MVEAVGDDGGGCGDVAAAEEDEITLAGGDNRSEPWYRFRRRTAADVAVPGEIRADPAKSLFRRDVFSRTFIRRSEI
ncbi:hypothetical protein L1987_61893 [Smallanthus sonchifolius]|uniref:Uncharacterized protein n=1 Tax=Smallanthus sonchifolius TaxID=185202 RepID=A0ACB9C8W9_9ASTR|nr:hypothetical protein L1987_61893 [Smallanthus sonchifolius]